MIETECTIITLRVVATAPIWIDSLILLMNRPAIHGRRGQHLSFSHDYDINRKYNELYKVVKILSPVPGNVFPLSPNYNFLYWYCQ